ERTQRPGRLTRGARLARPPVVVADGARAGGPSDRAGDRRCAPLHRGRRTPARVRHRTALARRAVERGALRAPLAPDFGHRAALHRAGPGIHGRRRDAPAAELDVRRTFPAARYADLVERLVRRLPAAGALWPAL